MLNWKNTGSLIYLTVLTIFFIISFTKIFAQDFWQQTNGPEGGHVDKILVHPSGDLFLGTYYGNFYSSINDGSSWSEKPDLPNQTYNIVVNSAGTMFAGCNGGGVYISTDNGDSWQLRNEGLTNTNIHCIAIEESTGRLYVGTYAGGIFYSDNIDAGWGEFNNGLTNYENLRMQNIYVHSNGDVYACGWNWSVEGAVYKINASGDGWDVINGDITNTNIRDVYLNSSNHVFVATYGGGIFRSMNGGANWTRLSTGMTTSYFFTIYITPDDYLFAGSVDEGLFRSNTNGNEWTQQTIGIWGQEAKRIVKKESTGDIFAGMNSSGIFRSSDNGESWNPVNGGVVSAQINEMEITPWNHLFAICYQGGVYRSEDFGQSWISVNSGITDLSLVAITSKTGNVFVSTQFDGVLRSTNNGDNWASANNGISHQIYTLYANSNGDVFAGGSNGIIYQSFNNGDNWTLVNSDTSGTVDVIVRNPDNGFLFAGLSNDRGVLRSQDDGSSWAFVNNGLGDLDINDISVTKDFEILAATNNGLFRSDNNGTNWSQVDIGDTPSYIFALETNSAGHIYLGIFGQGVFQSKNNGIDWAPLNDGLSNLQIKDLTLNQDNYLFAGSHGGGVFKSVLPGQAPVIFQVNMSIKMREDLFRPQDGDQIVVRGINNVWLENVFVLEDTDLDSIYTITGDVGGSPDEIFEYKFVIDKIPGGDIYEENPNPDNPPYGNRTFNYSGESQTLPVVFFNNDEVVSESFAIISPNGGENWNEDSRQIISWDPGIGPNIIRIQLLYSVDNGMSYNEIIDSTGNDGSCFWKLPRTPGDEALIKIIGYDAESNSIEDISDDVFVIQDVDIYVLNTENNLNFSHAIRNDGKSGSVKSGSVTSDEPPLEYPVGSERFHMFMNNFLIATLNSSGDTVAAQCFYTDNFMPTTPITVSDHGDYVETFTKYLDKLGLGLEIEEKTIAFKNSTFIIFLYEIYNDSNINYPEFYAGLYNDFDISDPQFNRTGYAQANRLAYIYDTEETWDSYAGIRLLNTDPLAFRRSSGIFGNDPITPGEVFRLLATPGYDDPSSDPPDDYRVTMSAGPFDLPAYSQVKIPFVLAVGDGLDELTTASQQAQNIWVAPNMTINNAEGRTPVSAVLKATINTHGLNSDIYFEYGESMEYGNIIVAEQSPVDAAGPVAVSAEIYGLNPGTTYHFMAVVSNFTDEIHSPDHTFTTLEYSGEIQILQTTSFPSYDSPDDYTMQDYRIVGLPGNGNELISQYLNGQHKDQWQVYWDDGTDNNYFIEYNGNNVFRCSSGRAFWVIQMGDLNINTNVESANLNYGNGTVTIQLHDGFNLITNPYNFDMDWNLVKVLNGFTEDLWSYNGQFTQTTNFRKGIGYYYDNINNRSSIDIPFPTDMSKMSPGLLSGGNKKGFIWNMNIELSCKDFVDNSTVMGIAGDAEKDLDKHDQRRPRAFGSLPLIYFDRPRWIDCYPVFAVDIRPEFENYECWDFNVYSSDKEEITLTFLNTENVQENFELYLTDKTYSKFVNLREQSSYHFTPVKNTSGFQVIVGNHEDVHEILDNLIPRSFHVGQNYPNPFNPSTTIPVEIPVETQLSVKIYNILGQEVATVFNGELPVGKHFFNWNGQDFSGKNVSGGVYIYNIKLSNGKIYSGKMILMK